MSHQYEIATQFVSFDTYNFLMTEEHPFALGSLFLFFGEYILTEKIFEYF